MAERTYRGLAVTAVKYGIAILALGWLLTQIDLDRTLALLGRLDVLTLGAVIIVSLAGLLGRFYTWQATMAPVKRISLWTAGAIALIVNFINQLLPSRLTGRVAAPFVLKGRTGVRYADAAAVSGVHTAIYSLYYGVVATIGLLLGYQYLSTGLTLALVLSTALYFVAGTVLLLAGMNLKVLEPIIAALATLATYIPWIGERIARRVRGMTEFADTSSAMFRRITTQPRVWVRYAVGWSIVLLLAPGIRVVLLLESFDVQFTPLVLLPIYLVMAYSITLLPLTPGGIGVTEATATAVFVGLGIPAEVIVPIILIDRALSIYLPALAGWYPSLQIDFSELSTDTPE